ELAAVAGGLEALGQRACRLDGERAASDQSEARREGEPLGGGALERADENAGRVVRRAAVIESEVQLGQQLLQEPRFGEDREHESRIPLHQSPGKFLPHALWD